MRYLYLHGFGSSGSTSQKAGWLREKMAEKGLELECPDLVPGDFSQITLSGQIQVVDDILGGSPSCLVGSSLGGLVAANYAISHPEVQALVLLAPAFGFPARWVEGLGEEGLGHWEKTGWLEVYHHAEERDTHVHYGFYKDALRHSPEPPVKQPTTIIHGTDDETVPIGHSHSFLQVAPRAELIEVDGGHALDSDAALDAIWRGMAGRFGL